MDIIGHPILGDPDYWFQEGGRLPPSQRALCPPKLQVPRQIHSSPQPAVFTFRDRME